MDRPEYGLIKWSPNAARDSFLHINLQHRVVQVYEPTGRAQRGRFDYKKLAKHDDLPPLTTYDWSPSVPGLVAVGTSTGVVNLLRIDDNSNAYMELGLKMSRICQAVAFSTAGKLAVALDRVRSDNCLYIWDVSRLSTVDSTVSGFPTDIEPPSDPTERLEPSVSVSSVRFFEDNPNVLVAGIKGQGLRIHDLRGTTDGYLNGFGT
jgi:WD repeat-containing protein mio